MVKFLLELAAFGCLIAAGFLIHPALGLFFVAATLINFAGD